MQMNRPPLTFVLPGDNRSGGVRATAMMCDQLRMHGYPVRIAYRRRSRAGWVPAHLAQLVTYEGNSSGWLQRYAGRVEQYRDLGELTYQAGEVVIAVGSLTLQDVNALRVPGIIKVRYNHGLPSPVTREFIEQMSSPLPTIAVAKTLVPDLELLCRQHVDAVVPNGVDRREYFPSTAERDAVGMIFSTHPMKAPDDALLLVRRIREEFPRLPILTFGTERRPREMRGCDYERAPSVERARDLYSRSLIWLVCSASEGFALPILEAMACGAVVVSTDTHGGRELICHGVNGMLVRVGDIDAFVRAIRILIADPVLRERMVEAGHKTCRTFSWPSAANRMGRFLRALADTRAGVSRADPASEPVIRPRSARFAVRI